MINPMDLTGRHILVTGASSGIGRQTAIQISRLGGRVSLIARNKEKLQETLSMMDGNGHDTYPFDLSDSDNMHKLVQEIVGTAGKIDGFAHCAGNGFVRPLQFTTPQFLDEAMRINFNAFIELSRILSKRNCNSHASFVAISSIASVQGEKSQIAYSASKGALDSAIRCMAQELGGKGIRINSVVPGFIKTALYDQYIHDFGEEAFHENYLKQQYLGLGEPVDVANAVCFLLSDASKFITGTGLIVDGGYLS